MAETQRDWRKLSSRFALSTGFGILLIIVAIAGVDAISKLRQIRQGDDATRQQFLARNRILNGIRSDVYLSGTYVRDYLLDPEPQRAEGFRRSLERVRRQMQSALDTYGDGIASEQVKPYTSLQRELAVYWQVLDPILQWTPQQRREKGYAFLRDEVFPRRMAMLDLAQRIGEINEQQLAAGNRQVADLLTGFQYRLLVSLLATLLFGVGIAAVSARSILRLEAQANEHIREVEEARAQLGSLSTKLRDAQENERRSLSRELHDEVGQSLSAALVEIRNLASGLNNRSSDQTRTQLDDVRGLIESTIRTVRNMSLLLRPSMLDDLGLVPALRWQAREISKRTGMEISVDTLLVSDDLPDDVKTCLYRVVQEALHNIAKHSAARQTEIGVRQAVNAIEMTIHDNGKGFDVKNTKGMGLLGIEERVAQLGGSFHIESQPNLGTRLELTLPLTLPSSQQETREIHSYSVSG